MEELLVYALLLYEGLDLEEDYNNRLDELFLEDPNNEILIDLEFMSNNIKESVVFIRRNFCYDDFDQETFGEILMKKLKEYYANTEIKVFASKMYSLWESLPGNIQNEQPFFVLCYADDPLSWGDEKQTRELYEHMLNFYER